MTPFYADAQDPPSKLAMLNAALRLFVERGIDGTSVRDIAARAEFSNPVIFKYFSSRDALALHLFERCFRHFSQTLERATANDKPFARRVHGLAAAYWHGMHENLDAFLFLHDNQRQLWPRVCEELRPFALSRRIRKLLQEGQNARLIDPELDLDLAASAIVGTFLHVARRAYAGEAITSPERMTALVEKILS